MSDNLDEWYLSGALHIESAKVSGGDEYIESFGYRNVWGKFTKIAAEKMWGLQNCYGILQNYDSDHLFIGLKDEGANRKDAVIAFGDDPQESLRFLFTPAGIPAPAPKELLRVTASGSVGIGTTDPQAPLEIKGGTGGKFQIGRQNIAFEGGNEGGNLHIESKEGMFLNYYSNKPIYFGSGNIGIGTTNPTHPLHVKTDWGFLALDSNRAGQDSGLRLMEGGLVKWHISNSAQNAKLSFARDGLPATLTFDQVGNIDIGLNPLRFSSGWTGSTDAEINRAEISNDTNEHKTLMIVGNRSAGGKRRVSVWDRLEVNGELTTTRNLIIGTGSNASLLVRHINGKNHQNDSFEGLYLNYDTGQPVHVGGGQKSNLYVHGSILTQPISNDRAKEILNNEENGTAIVGAANGLNEARIDFFFKYRNEVYRAFIKGERI